MGGPPRLRIHHESEGIATLASGPDHICVYDPTREDYHRQDREIEDRERSGVLFLSTTRKLGHSKIGRQHDKFQEGREEGQAP
jgi:hypothetical protein